MPVMTVAGVSDSHRSGKMAGRLVARLDLLQRGFFCGADVLGIGAAGMKAASRGEG